MNKELKIVFGVWEIYPQKETSDYFRFIAVNTKENKTYEARLYFDDKISPTFKEIDSF